MDKSELDETRRIYGDPESNVGRRIKALLDHIDALEESRLEFHNTDAVVIRPYDEPKYTEPSTQEQLERTAIALKGTEHGGAAQAALYYLREYRERIDALERQVEALSKVPDWKLAVQTAYGWLWRINTEPLAPIKLLSAEKAAFETRKILRDLLSQEEKKIGITTVTTLFDGPETAIASVSEVKNG